MPPGRPPKEVLPDWPALMTTALAARYLSVDEHSLRMIAEASGVRPVDVNLDVERWRRSDLDRIVRGLPSRSEAQAPEGVPKGGPRLSEADIDRIAVRLQGTRTGPQRRLYSLKDAAAACGLSRATLYRMTKRGDLKTIRLGARTLVPSEEVEALIEGGDRGVR